jgi:periplasmic protein TonB
MKRIIILSFFLIFSFFVKAQKADNEQFDCILPIEWNPEFKGGQKALKLFLSKNLKYPKTNACVSGKIYIQFIVEEDGRVTNPEILKSLFPKEFDDEALRVIRLMPKWIPGKDYQGIKPMRMKFTIPIDFTLK